MNDLLNHYKDMANKRWRLYIGDSDFIALRHICTGYHMCMADNAIPDNGSFQKFESFVFDKLNTFEGTLSIWKEILEHTQSDEEAFNLFFSLVEEFCEKN